MKRICVFCSASSQLRPEIFSWATDFSAGLVERKWELIYGGGKLGLMGHFADQVLARGGIARGIIPGYLAATREVMHFGLTENIQVQDLFERKRLMMEKSDAFVIFPGGFGTLDEALEVITWKVLGQLDKPIVFANLEGFWHNQLKVFDELLEEGMITSGALRSFVVCNSLGEIWSVLEQPRVSS